MELFLNLFWILVAVASLFYYRRRLEATVPIRRLACHSGIALGCALAILFPVISLTDDLHAEQAVMEDSNGTRKSLKSAAAGDRSPGKVKFHRPPAELFSAALVRPLVAALGLATLPAFFIISKPSPTPFKGRAPPLTEN